MPALRLRSLFITGLAAVLALEVSALGLGGGGSGTAVLGQPLDFAVQLRLAPGESIEERCVRARVNLGERVLVPAAVRTSLEYTGPQTVRVRVVTATSVDEPVVTVAVTAGCTASVTRSFVLFADPPDMPEAAVLAMAQAPVPVNEVLPGAPAGDAAAAGFTAADSTAAGQALGTGAGTSRAAADVAPAAALAAPGTATDATALAAPEDPAAARRAAQARAQAQAEGAARLERQRAQREARARARQQAAERVRVQAAERPSALAAAGPRLRLDAPEPPPSAEAQAVEQAIQAVAQAASAARAMAASASAAEQRIVALERTVEELRGQAQTNAQANMALRAQVAKAQGANHWMGPLLLAFLVLGALAAWLAWRLAELQRLRRAGWREAAAPGAAASESLTPQGAQRQALADPPSQQMTMPIPFVTSELMTQVPAQRQRSAPAWPRPVTAAPETVPDALPPAGVPAAPAGAAPAFTNSAASAVAAVAAARADHGPEDAMQRTDVLPAHLRPGLATAREVAIEELIDLEQQAEFFVVLGQDESAIDLLVDHLRNTGGGSPLPYLKLLEIYRRRGDREAYDRTRTRFNHRFNAYAPDWDADLLHGRSLEEYEGVLLRLQQVWPRPLDAMAELEALLFRKSHGELFDLPAYREVLFLCALARDLLDRESLDSGTVDLLLPLSLGLVAAASVASAVSPGIVDLGPTSQADPPPTAPVDLDLSQSEQRTSIFDPLDDLPTRPHKD
jgi:hypothetical protein